MQIDFAKSTKISVNLRQVWAKWRLNSGVYREGFNRKMGWQRSHPHQVIAGEKACLRKRASWFGIIDLLRLACDERRSGLLCGCRHRPQGRYDLLPGARL